VYASVWNKYFPVVRILMKRSVDSEQTLNFNSIDFEKSGKGRKTVQKFIIEFMDGKLTGMIKNNLLAQSLAAMLIEMMLPGIFYYRIIMNLVSTLSLNCI